MYHVHHQPPVKRTVSPVRYFLRRNGFVLSLFAAAVLVLLGTQFLKQRVRAGLHAPGSADSQAAACQAKLEAAGIHIGEVGPVRSSDSDLYVMQRHAVYTHMAADISQKGLALGGVITQGLTQDDLFRFTVSANPARRLNGGGSGSTVSIQPILTRLDVPVRATILPLLDAAAAAAISEAMQQLLLPKLPQGGVWVQDSNLFHATLYHASSHVKPVPASTPEVMEEARQVRAVAGRTCPVQAVLERVVVTSGGVIVACWQATQQGGEPALLRQALSEALPHAPPKEAQMVKEPSMLHTTLARLLLPPDTGDPGPLVDQRAVVQAVQQLSDALCGLHAVFSEVWYIEEQDLLALALRGSYIRHPAPLTCPPGTGTSGSPSAGHAAGA